MEQCFDKWVPVFSVITHIITNKGREDEDCKLVNMNVVFKNPFIGFMNIL